MEKRTIEWLEQAAYDLDTADYMQKGGRMIYAVFMCHLAVEKALKGIYFEKRKFPRNPTTWSSCSNGWNKNRPSTWDVFW